MIFLALYGCVKIELLDINAELYVLSSNLKNHKL